MMQAQMKNGLMMVNGSKSVEFLSGMLLVLYLIGGLEPDFYVSIYWEFNHPNLLSLHHFLRGLVYHQPEYN
jgi:hypothetical protein